MRRIQFIEVHESNWCPKSIRDAATDNLQFALNLVNQYAPIIPHLRRALERSGATRIVDLCSGAGGPWLYMHRLLESERNGRIEIWLSDKYPNVSAFQRAQNVSRNRIKFYSEPIDVLKLPPDLKGFRTFFTCFHHFRPEKARAILEDAVKSGQGIGVFEVTARRPLMILLMLLAPVVVLAVTPFVRPFRWSRLFWTYLIPVVPLVNLFDGIISCLRTYSLEELHEMIATLDRRGYTWQIGKASKRLLPIAVTYLTGYPRSACGGPDNLVPSK